ncbi:hypothetical protein BC629DRAFT_1109790 [Irpex lacteus]|nr:hypothetical protein BC629DRAFT_1109790 [Irpex lacteus]
MNTNKRLYREDERIPGPSGGHDHDPREDVRYVLSGQPTGWAAMATKVREFDEERIKDTKEDMDTLLVFAGLFSAVLTAFLVESYQRLLPDTASQMLVTSSQTLAVMRQMSLQMSNPAYSPDIFANTTTTEVFQPSSDDIRVNVLWFASLIFSLMTASFGILVKQWLREYLAVDNPSPHARLRVHHYRYPGLAQWKVFEIAAILPLLQQLALALFFIGLCYFTASVHSSIGHTSLPLVAGWAFCFTTVTLLPVLLPRCPYRTTLLTSLHIRLARSLNWILARAYRGRCLQFFKQKGWLEWLWSIWQHLDYHCVQNDERCIVTRRTADLDILAEVDAVQSDDDLLVRDSSPGTSLAELKPAVRTTLPAGTGDWYA